MPPSWHFGTLDWPSSWISILRAVEQTTKCLMRLLLQVHTKPQVPASCSQCVFTVVLMPSAHQCAHIPSTVTNNLLLR